MTPDELLQRFPRETLRWLRDHLKMNQYEFASSIGVPKATVSRWEVRKTRISNAHRYRIINDHLRRALASVEGEFFLRALHEYLAERSGSARGGGTED